MADRSGPDPAAARRRRTIWWWSLIVVSLLAVVLAAYIVRSTGGLQRSAPPGVDYPHALASRPGAPLLFRA